MAMTGDAIKHGYEKLVDKGIVKQMQELLGTDDEFMMLTGILAELRDTLKGKEKEYGRIEYMMRMVGGRISSIRKEELSRRMVERGFYMEGEF